jgi:hypothetical protein
MKNSLSLPIITFALQFSLAGCQTKPAEAPAVGGGQAVAAAVPSSQPSSQPKDASVSASNDTQADWTQGPVHRGASFSVNEDTALAAVLEKPEEFSGKLVKVSGQVTRACSKKGCWMELRADPAKAGVRITFKDYGFFVPLDSAGASATVEGTVKVEHLSADHVEHLKAEGANVVADDKGEAKEIGLVATAVRLEKASPTAGK